MATIKCPICYKEFEPHEVHFRSKLNNGLGEFDYGDEIDEVYERNYKRITGQPTQKKLRRALSIYDVEANGVILSGGDRGIPVGLHEADHVDTYERLCPCCHFPLPTDAGLYDTLLVSFTGNTQVGKTILMLSLCNSLEAYSMRYGRRGENAVNFKFDTKFDREVSNALDLDSKTDGYSGEALGRFKRYGILPPPTRDVDIKPRLPLVFTIINTAEPRRSRIICMYDMAGELLRDTRLLDNAENYAKSDAAMLLIDPCGISAMNRLGSNEADNELELAHLNEAWDNAHADSIKKPFAFVLTKSDYIYNAIGHMPDVGIALSARMKQNLFINSDHRAGYRTDELIGINNCAYSFLRARSQSNAQAELLCNFYDQKRSMSGVQTQLFMISALGSDPVKMTENDMEALRMSTAIKTVKWLNAAPRPMRTLDPLMWMLYTLNIVPNSDGKYRTVLPAIKGESRRGR